MAYTGTRTRRFISASVAALVVFVSCLAVATPSVASSPDIPAIVSSIFTGKGIIETASDYIELQGVGATDLWQIDGTYAGGTVRVIVERWGSAAAAKEMYDYSAEGAMSGFPDAVNEYSGRSSVDGDALFVTTGGELLEGVLVSKTWFIRDEWDVMVVCSNLNDTGLTHDIAVALDEAIVRGGAGTGSEDPGTEDVAEIQEPGLSVSASPSTFSALGDTVRLDVRLTGEDISGHGVSVAGSGVSLDGTSDLLGQASFTLTHADEGASEYRYTVSAAGMSREIVIPVLALKITPETNAVTGEPFRGVVADGRSALAIEIDLGASVAGTLQVTRPDIGTVGGDGVADDGGIALSDGTAMVTYTPPSYLDSSALTERVPVPASDGFTLGSARAAKTVYANQGSPWAAKVPLTFTFTAEDGAQTEVVIDVLVARAPVMLVHGFTGDRTTWVRLQDYLATRGFDPVINEYYEGNQGIHDQSEALGGDIAREIDRYAALGLRAERVDIVGHSMGGLIARNYVWGFEPHPTDVRKIVMVGTPNHGANFFDKVLGNMASDWSKTHQLASEQLYSGGAFLAKLNEGEAVGRHLNPDVQYGNIYGERSDYVVTNTSAHLNGVASRRIYGVTHSPAIPLPGQPITESATVFSWVEDWLGSDISRAALRGTEVKIVDGAGDVRLSGVDFSTGDEVIEVVAAYPTTVDPWEEVHTGSDGRARLRLYVDGLAWGTISLGPDTRIALGNVAPGAVTVRVRSGSARFTSLKRSGGGHFQVVVGEQPPGEWYTFNPDAKVIGLDTDFVVATGEDGVVETLVLEGSARIDDGSTTNAEEMVVLGENQAGAVGAEDGYVSQLAQDQWWTDGFYRPGLLEVLQDWWAIARAWVGEWFDSADIEPVATAEVTP